MEDQVLSAGADMDEVVNDYLQLQIVCMLLQHEGCNKIRANDSENGLSMLDSVRNMRESLGELYDSIGEEIFEETCQRINFDKQLFTAVSDAVLKDNTLYFYFGPRQYPCDEITCRAKTFALAREYFPTFYGKAA